MTGDKFAFRQEKLLLCLGFSILLRVPETNYPVARGGESHLGCTGMRGHDLPTVIKLLEVHGGVPDHLLLGTRKSDRPPGESQREVRLKRAITSSLAPPPKSPSSRSHREVFRNSRPSTDLLALAEYCPDVRNCRDQIHAAAHRRIFFSGGNRNWSARWKLAAARRPDRSAIHSLSFSRCPPLRYVVKPASNSVGREIYFSSTLDDHRGCP